MHSVTRLHTTQINKGNTKIKFEALTTFKCCASELCSTLSDCTIWPCPWLLCFFLADLRSSLHESWRRWMALMLRGRPSLSSSQVPLSTQSESSPPWRFGWNVSINIIAVIQPLSITQDTGDWHWMKLPCWAEVNRSSVLLSHSWISCQEKCTECPISELILHFSFPYFSEPPIQIFKPLWEAGRKVGQFAICWSVLLKAHRSSLAHSESKHVNFIEHCIDIYLEKKLWMCGVCAHGWMDEWWSIKFSIRQAISTNLREDNKERTEKARRKIMQRKHT